MKDDTRLPRLVTADVVAQMFGIRRAQVYVLVKAGVLGAVHLGRALRFDRQYLEEEFIRNGGARFEGGWRKKLEE